jgi:hypothetical protein
VTVESWHLDIGNDEIRPLSMECPDPFETVSSLDDINIGLKSGPHKLTQVGIVFNYQDAG